MLQSHTSGADLSAPPPENPHARPLLLAKVLQDADRWLMSGECSGRSDYNLGK